jgi:DNA-binding MarR family transcriptional regulator
LRVGDHDGGLAGGEQGVPLFERAGLAIARTPFGYVLTRPSASIAEPSIWLLPALSFISISHYLSYLTIRLSREQLLLSLIAEVRASQVATDALDQAVADHFGLNRTDARALDVLDQHEGPITAGELAQAMHLTTGAVTSVLDRLEKAGWAKRVRDPNDRRRVLVEATPKVKKMGDSIYGGTVDVLDAFPDYTEEQLELLLDFTRRGRAWTESRIANAQAQMPDRTRRRQLRGRGRA